MPRARIIIIGNFGLDFATENHLARDAQAIGCTVIKVEERSPVIIDELRALSVGADLVLYMKSYGLPPEFEQVWRDLEGVGVQTASFHLDLYVGLVRQAEVGVDPFWKTGTVFSADGDSVSAAYFEALGIKHHWLPPAIVSDECNLSPEHYTTPDIVFVGKTNGYHPEWPWRQTLIEGVQRRYGERFRAFDHSSQMRGKRLNRLYSKPGRIVIGDTLALPGHARYWSDRYYETVGRGGFLIAPWVPGIDDHFGDGQHLRFFYHWDLDDVFDLVDYYLDNPDQAWDIARKGQRWVAHRHTYQHRVDAMLTELGL